MTRSGNTVSSGDWLQALRRFVLASALANLVWEFAQLPLYTIWYEGSAREIIVAAVHCTGGDILISTTSLLGALVIIGTGHWPRANFLSVAAAAIVGGIAYAIFSEWLNTEIRGSWAYSEFMPILPFVGAGLSPLAQWIIVPVIALWWARRAPGGARSASQASRDKRARLSSEDPHGPHAELGRERNDQQSQ